MVDSNKYRSEIKFKLEVKPNINFHIMVSEIEESVTQGPRFLGLYSNL